MRIIELSSLIEVFQYLDNLILVQFKFLNLIGLAGLDLVTNFEEPVRIDLLNIEHIASGKFSRLSNGYFVKFLPTH